MQFEWSEKKRRENLKRHGIDLHDAAHVFFDDCRVEWFDDREDYGEDRFVTIGAVEGRVVVVVYTERGAATRLISARRADKRERERYENQYRP